MTALPDKYASFVEHPRYGKRPRYTGFNPKLTSQRYFHWHSSKSCRIPGTAIEADLARQTPATVAVTHYFDVERACRDCGRQFIFFAEEQKYWYEELGLRLESDCVRCVPCRKRQRGIARVRERYESLFHVLDRTPDETLEMAECCVKLMEEGVFHSRQAERVRMLLRTLPDEYRTTNRFNQIFARLREFEKRMRE